MNKHIYKQLVLLIVLVAFNQALSAQNKFEYKLVKPNTNEVTIKSSEKLLVEIQFNAEAVNEAGAYIATFLNGKMPCLHHLVPRRLIPESNRFHRCTDPKKYSGSIPEQASDDPGPGHRPCCETR